MCPLLYLICGNGLPNASKFHIKLFANGIILHVSHKDIKSLQTNVQHELDTVDIWMRSNRLITNYNKTACMITNRSYNFLCDICMNNAKIHQTDGIKYQSFYN